MMTMPKETRQIVKAATAAGWRFELRRSGHGRLTAPDGRYVTFSASPRCPNAPRRLLADLRRAGCEV